MSGHRRVPIPHPPTPGRCRWCGEETGSRRRTWHPECVTAYRIQAWPAEQRRFVRARDGAVCASCGEDTERDARSRAAMLTLGYRGRHGVPRPWVFVREARQALGRRPRWHVDHIVPLIDGGTQEPENLQTLCTACHKAKTASEATARADRRAGRAVLA